MIKRIVLPLASLLLVGCPGPESNHSPESPDSSQTRAAAGAPESETGEWVSLMGNDISDHWAMYNGDSIQGWTLQNGELISSGAGWDQNQDLITQREYSDFELSLEWKIAPENSSGIFFHVQRDSLKPIYESAPEYQILDDAGWPTKMKPNQYTAGSYAMYAPEGASPHAPGSWNTTKIRVRYPLVEHWLNGKKVVSYEIGSPDWEARKAADKWADVPEYGQARSGHIGLQNAGKVVFRKIKVREL